MEISQDGLATRYVAALTLMFIVLAGIKSPGLFIDPRYWAEEATEYYPKIISHPGIGGMLISVRGSFQLFATGLVWLSTLVPLDRAPFITTYGALILHTIVAMQLSMFVAAYKLPKYSGVLLVVAWAFLPSTYEVWLTATNVQWVAGCSMLLLALMPADWLQRHSFAGLSWTIACGLSGIPSILVAPVFLLRYLLERRTVFLFHLAAVFICGLVAVAVVLHGGAGPRDFHVSATILLIPSILQTVITPIVGDGVATFLLFNMWPPIVIIGLPIAAAAIAAGWSSDERNLALTVAVAWSSITLLQLFGAIKPSGMLQYLNGSRYFMAGSLCLCLALALGTASRVKKLRLFAVSLLCIIAINGIFQRWVSGRGDFFVGPSWAKGVSACRNRLDCTVPIWPGFNYPLSVFLRP